MTTTRKKAAAKKTPEAPKKNVLFLVQQEGKSDQRTFAECGLSAVMGNAATARTFLHGSFGELDINELSAVMREKAAKVQSGDLSGLEATLTAQAAMLDTMFNEMARRGALNMGQHLPATETYLRLALKAQAQCRSTIEALAEIKNPRPVAFVKQANISGGPQQVNNGMLSSTREHAHAREEKPIQSNELSGAGHELLPDTRTSQAASRANQEMEAVGEVHRATD